MNISYSSTLSILGIYIREILVPLLWHMNIYKKILSNSLYESKTLETSIKKRINKLYLHNAIL